MNNIAPNYDFPIGKHKEDLESKDHYPFNGGWIYSLPKQLGNFKNELLLSFRSYTLEWMSQPFYYEEVDTTIFKEKDFKDRNWFDQTSYYEIIETFGDFGCGDYRKKVIYLIDKGQIKNGKAYMVRVYFYYSAEE